MPYEYVAEMVDFIAANYNVSILFNYAPKKKKKHKNLQSLPK
jgi:heptosyltransferase-2